MELTAVAERFILHWGEMGTRWGINRSVAQIHALLYISEDPLHAEEIAETLSLARSNVSTSLKELQGWGIVSVQHLLGDRRDHFASMKDPWEMFRVIMAERKRREVDPTLEMLRELTGEAGSKGKGKGKGKERDDYIRERLVVMRDFLESMSGCWQQVSRLPRPAFMRLVQMGDKVRKVLGLDRAG